MQDRIQLPFRFDPHLLQKDLSTLEKSSSEWIDHFVKQNYEGSWSIIPLRGPKGAKHPILMSYSDPACKDFADTPFVAMCPYFQEVINTFKCKVESVRLMKLSAGSEIKEHTDYDLSFEDGTVRIHVPIVTHDKVAFYLNQQRVMMQAGECWYLKLSDPHRVINNGPDRVHMVLDMKVNNWLKGIFESTATQV